MHLLFESRGRRQSVPSSPTPTKPEQTGAFQSFRRLQAGAASRVCAEHRAAVRRRPATERPGADRCSHPNNAPGMMVDLHPTSRDFEYLRGYWKNPLGPTSRQRSSLHHGKLHPTGGSGQGRQNLSKPERRHGACAGEQLRHRHPALQPGHCRYRYSSCQIRCCDLIRRSQRPRRENHRRNELAVTGQRRRPGRLFSGHRWRWRRHAGQSLTTSGLGPSPEVLDPMLSGTIQLQRQTYPTTSSFSGSYVDTNTDEYNFTYTQGWISWHATTGRVRQ